MISVGTDIIQIDRIAKTKEKFGNRFLEKYLNKDEYSTNTNDSSLAGLWAVKEAVAKALGCGIGKELSFLDMSIKKDSKGAPYLEFRQEIKERFSISQSSISISHDGGFAIAIAVIVRY